VTHSRIPYNEEAIDVIAVNYPKVVAPGEKFRPEIIVSPRAGYSLRESKGDALKHIDPDDSQRFGAYIQMAVKDTVLAFPRRHWATGWTPTSGLNIRCLVTTAQAICNNLRATAQRATFAGLPAARRRS